MEEISSIKHEAFRYAQDLIKPSGREGSGRYLVESANFVRQALESSSSVEVVFALPEESLKLRATCVEQGARLYTLRPGLMQKLVGTGYETSVTAIAIVGKRLLPEESLLEARTGFYLVGESIQDPRNVGVLIRTAEAAGCTALVLSADSAEPFSRASVRSTTGSILRMPLCITPDLVGLMSRFGERGGAIVASSARAEKLVYESDLCRNPLAVLVGNETQGISSALRGVATDFVALPMSPEGASSLNVTVAAGVLLYEVVRQRLPRS